MPKCQTTVTAFEDGECPKYAQTFVALVDVELKNISENENQNGIESGNETGDENQNGVRCRQHWHDFHIAK